MCLGCHDWCCVNNLRFWNGYYYLAWNFIGLVYSSSKLIVLTSIWYVAWPFSNLFFLLNGLDSCLNLHATIIISSIVNQICCSCETFIDIWHIPPIILIILDDGVNFVDNLTSNYTIFICIIYGIKFGLTKNGSMLFTLRELRIFSLFCTNCSSPKPIPYIFSSKWFWTYFLICGYFTKSMFNICCPTCLINPSLISLSIYGHFVMTCLLTLYKAHILEKSWTNLIESS